MKLKTLFFCASALALASCCGVKEPANIENVVAYTRVGDIGARERLGAKNELIQIYDDAHMQKFGIPRMISHFSWVPLLNDYSEGTAMDWLVKQM